MNLWRFLKELRVDQAFSVHIHAICNGGLIAEFSWFSWHCTELAFLRPEGRCAGTFPVLFLRFNFYCLLHWDTLHIEFGGMVIAGFQSYLFPLDFACCMHWRRCTVLEASSSWILGVSTFQVAQNHVGRQEDWWVTFAIRRYLLVFKA